jgi:hypothetical protein
MLLPNECPRKGRRQHTEWPEAMLAHLDVSKRKSRDGVKRVNEGVYEILAA